MSRAPEPELWQDFLTAYDPQLVPHMLAFADRLTALPVGVIMTMARKATCLVDAMIQLGAVRTNSHLTSDRVLDMNIAWLRGRRVALVDDLIVSGTTLCRTVERVVAAGAADVSVHAIVVDTDWWSPQLVQPVDPYVMLDDKSSMAFCTQTILALNTMPRPYNVDWPLYAQWSMSGAVCDCLGALSGWRARDVTSISQALRGVVTITCDAAPVTLAMLNQRCGWPISQHVELAKVRVFARELSDVPTRFAMQALPIVTFAGMSISHVDAMWSSLVRHHQVADAVAAEFSSPESRLRLIQYLAAAELGRLWFAAVGGAAGIHIDAQFNENQLNYAFPPHVAGLVATYARAGGEFLGATPDASVEPMSMVPDHQRELMLVTALGTGAAAVQAQLTEPFLQMYRDDEVRSRTLVLRDGRAALSNKSFTRTLDRLNRGLSLAQLEKLAGKMAEVTTPRSLVSLFLDIAVDQGIAVPITVVNENQVVRAFRHGEDVRSVETDWRLYGTMLAALARAWRRRELPDSVVESALSIFVRLGVKRGLLTPWHGRLGATGTAGVRYGVVGSTLHIDTSSIVAGAFGQGMVDLLVSGGVLRRGRRKQSYQLGRIPEASATTAAQERGAEDIGWLIGHLLGRDGSEGLSIDELSLLASCANKLDVPFALAGYVASTATLIWVILPDIDRNTVAGSGQGRVKALQAADGGVRRYQQVLNEMVPGLVERVGQHLTDPLYRHHWEMACEQLTGGESEHVSDDSDAPVYRLGAWLSAAAAHLRLVEAAHIVGRRPARKTQQAAADRLVVLRSEIERLVPTFRPSPELSLLAGPSLLEWWDDNLRMMTAGGADTFGAPGAAGLRQLVSLAGAMVDETRARATSYGGVRQVRRFTSLVCVLLDGGEAGTPAAEQDLINRIDLHRNLAARAGVHIHPLPMEGDGPGLVIVGWGDEVAVWLGQLAADLCVDADGGRRAVVLVPDLPRDEHLFHGEGSVDYWGMGFWRRVEAVSRLMPTLRDWQIVVLVPASDGAEARARGVLRSDGPYASIELPANDWSSPARWTAATTVLPQPAVGSAPADIGVITILGEETRAVNEVLARAGTLRSTRQAGGRWFQEAQIDSGHVTVRVVATQALDRGQRSAAVAFSQLRSYCHPAIVVLVGIGGGIHRDLGLGDVAVSHDAIYYDMRKESSTGVRRRGQSHPVPASVRHAVNAFFAQGGEPFRLTVTHPDGMARMCKVLPGPIGSGEAVVAYRESSVRKYLLNFNDKTLALETEAGGVAQAFYEEVDSDRSLRGWLAIRGIADHADEAKDDAYHEIASRHAAAVFEAMLPFLKITDDG